MKPFHHIKVNQEMKLNLTIWLTFLNNPIIYCRSFIDFEEILTADELNWATDTSGKIGYGGVWELNWFKGTWPQSFIDNCKPSIKFLELFGVVSSVLLWGGNFMNRRICLFCDNQAVVNMINHSTSSCKNCMKLIRKLTLVSMELNLRVFAKFIPKKSNFFADALSRNQMTRFWNLAQQHGRVMNQTGLTSPLDLSEFHDNWNF